MANRRILPLLTLAAATALGACSSMGGGNASMPSGGGANRAAAADSGDTMVVLFPSVGASSALQSGCWATFYDERSFNGDSMTLVGPVELQTLDKGSAQQLKRDIKSVVTGPRATLVLYQKQFLSARSVGFEPGSREAGLVEKLGFGGRVESVKLSCSAG